MSSDQSFTLSNRSLKFNTAEDIKPHLTPLETPDSISSIHLNGNTFGVPAAQTLASYLPKQQTLEYANLADIFTSRLLDEIPPALSALLEALLQCPKLDTIDLSDNAFGLNTVAPLVAFLKAHTPLRHLILNNNGLGPRAGVMVADALAELAVGKDEARKQGKEVPELETIVCGRNRLESGSMAAWAKAFKGHKQVKVVRMVQNGIRQEGIATLLKDGLAGCKALETVDLQDNTFTIVGSKVLAEVVGGWGKLSELGVGDCLLGARGGVVVAEALAKGGNKELRILRAQYNEIDEKGLEALVGSVTAGGLAALRRVELNGNKFSEDDAKILKLREVLDQRRETAGVEEDDEGWGLDSLSDMEESESEEEEEEGSEAEEEKEEEEEREGKAEKILEDADQEEDAKVSQKKDKDVDDLADALGKTEI